MPLSNLTRLRGAVIVAGFAIVLLGLPIRSQSLVTAAALFVLPLLVWLLVSNAVKEAPPFDDTAFHRTRPVSAGRAFWQLARFHLLLLAGMLATLLAYCWRYHLGWRELVAGIVLTTVAWIGLAALCGVVASLATFKERWSGWGFVTVLLIPVVSLFGSNYWIRDHLSWSSLLLIPLVGALFYPQLWWLVAVKRRWLLGNVLGLVIGVSLPWASHVLNIPGIWIPEAYPWRKPELSIRRVPGVVETEGLPPEQTSVSRELEVHGLEANEFIQVFNLGISPGDPQSSPYGRFESDKVLNEMSGCAFTTDNQGRLIPATAVLLHSIGMSQSPADQLPIWRSHDTLRGRNETLESLLGIPTRSPSDYNRSRQPLGAETKSQTWTINGAAYRWVKVLNVLAKEGGRSRLPDGGVIQLLPLEVGPSDASIGLEVLKGYQKWTRPHVPVLVVRTDGGASFIELNREMSYFRGFLINGHRYEFRTQIGDPRGIERLPSLRDSRLEVYWPEFRGMFEAQLPRPD